MNHKHQPQPSATRDNPRPFYKSLTPNAWVSLAAIVGIILFYLLTHHKKHLFDVLPYILIVVMVVMHMSHGTHSGHGGKNHG